jgi:hypothetical protein
MSTTKIVVGAVVAVVAVVLILGLTFAVVHKLHAAQATFAWKASPASDPATREAQQQIKAAMAVYAHGLSTGNVQEAASLWPSWFHPAFRDGSPDPGNAGEQLYAPLLHSERAVQFTVTTCVVAGDRAAVVFNEKYKLIRGGGKLPKGTILTLDDEQYDLAKSGEKWVLEFPRPGEAGKAPVIPHKDGHWF